MQLKYLFYAAIGLILALVTLKYTMMASSVDKGCVPIHEKVFRIRAPGRYCLKTNLSPRLDFADHRAETLLIWIEASDVVLDLEGHRIGRFLAPFGYVGVGIQIEPSARRVTIQNGTLANLELGINRQSEFDYDPNASLFELEAEVLENGDLLFSEIDLKFSRVTFKACGVPYSIIVQRLIAPKFSRKYVPPTSTP